MRFTCPRGLTLTRIGILVFTLGILGCSGPDSPVAPTESASTSRIAAAKVVPNGQLQAVMAIQNAHSKRLMADPDVIGTATTLDDAGRPAIMLLVTTQAALASAPRVIDGVPVKVVLTDPIVAMKGPPDGKGPPGGGDDGDGVDHKAKQDLPIKLGTSGGWRYDLANGFCCGGTLGSLIQVGDQKRILSNYHVLEADIVLGGNNREAQNGDPVIQPGLIDVGCNANAAQNVATLVVTSSLPGNNVDASSATILPGQVDETGAILEIGTISSSTVAAFIGQNVKKSGRTTGLSRAEVTGLNATVSVSYDNECAGGAAFTKTFTDQILTTNKGSKFLAGGDSGSLMVEDVSSDARAVGLLYAGSKKLAVANPIGDVLSFLGATMVGN